MAPRLVALMGSGWMDVGQGICSEEVAGGNCEYSNNAKIQMEVD